MKTQNWNNASPSWAPLNAVGALSAAAIAEEVSARQSQKSWSSTTWVNDFQIKWRLKSGKPPLDRASYRGVSLIDTLAKVATRPSETVISKHLGPPINFAGSIRGRSTHHVIITAREIIRRANEQRKQVTAVLVEATSVFDTVDQGNILQELQRGGR